MKNIKLKGLFTCVTRSAYDVEDEILKLKSFNNYEITVVRETDKSIEDADIIVCSSLTSFLHAKEYYNSNMIVIVCDSVMQASCLISATPLDYEKRNSYDFFFRTPDYSLLKKSKGVTCEVTSFDMLGLVTANSMQGKMILTDYNKVMSYFDANTRHLMQVLVDSILFSGKNTKSLESFLAKECTVAAHKKDAKTFLEKLSTNLTKIRKAIKSSSKDFEIAYLRKMHNQLKSAKERTSTYTKRAEGPVNHVE